MINKLNSKNTLLSFNSEALADLLERIGWSFKDSGQDFFVIRSPFDQNNGQLTFVLPKGQSAIDSNSDLRLLIKTIAKLKNEDEEEIFNKIASVTDVEFIKDYITSLNFRAEYKEMNSIPMNLLRRVISGLAGCIEHSISLELQNNFIPWEEKISKDVKKIMDKIHFDQTKKGSFVGKITTTEKGNFSQLDLLDVRGRGIDHSAFARMAVGLEEISNLKIEKLQKGSSLIDALLVKDYGLNANMAELLMTVQSKTIPPIELDFNFHTKLIEEYHINKAFFRLNKDLLTKLKTYRDVLVEPKKLELQFILNPVAFASKDAENGDRSIRFDILTVNGLDVHIKKLSTQFDINQYKKIFDAHTDGKFINLNATVTIEKGKISVNSIEKLEVFSQK